MSQRFSAQTIRAKVVGMAHRGKTAHVGCALCLVELLAVLYRNHLKLDGMSPDDPNRNYLVLSKGHGVMALYPCLEELGWLKQSDLDNYFKNGTKLKGLCDVHVPGVEVTGGSLGHGLNVGTGLALAAKLSKTDQKCFTIVGDGEMNEGSMWEALLFAAHHKLDNLCVIVDENEYQAMGTTNDIMALGSLKQKFESFGFDCDAIDGHDETVIDQSLTRLMTTKNGRPKAIVARTVKGKGISFFEADNTWHYRRVSDEQYSDALKELGVA